MFKKKRNFLNITKYKLDRAHGRFKNPFNLKKGLAWFKLFRIINILLGIGIVFCLYFFIFSDFYTINNVEVSGNQVISTEDLLEIINNYLSGSRLFILKNNNIFLLSKDDLKRKITEAVIVNDIVIDKVLPNTIKVNLKEKNAALKWIANDQEYLVDNEGVVIKRFYNLKTPKIFQLSGQETQATRPETDNLIVIKNSENSAVNLGDKVLSKEDVDFINNLLSKLSKYDYLKIQEVMAASNFPAFLTLKTATGWQLFVNMADDLDSQLNRFDALVKDKIKKENLIGLDYIDLRLGESVYYKFK